MKLLKKLFTKKKPIFGSRIFEQQSWLDKKVQDALWKRRFPVD